MDNGPLGPKGRLRREAEQEWTIHNGQWTMDNGQWIMDNGQFIIHNGPLGQHDASLGRSRRFVRHGASHRFAQQLAQEVRGRR